MTENEVALEANGKEKIENNDEEQTELERAIIRQVEYYFGDMNLIRDKFFREQIKLDDGWIPMDVLVKCNRLSKLSSDFEVIAAALNKSTTGLIEVSDDKKKVRRSPEMPLPEMNEERRKEIMSRTIYAKGFPLDVALDDLFKFFKEQGETDNLVMRRYVDNKTKERKFKGSLFVTFKTKELAEKFLENKDLKYGEKELLIMGQDAYLQKKQEEYAERKDKKEKKSKDKEANAKEELKGHLKLPTGTVLYLTQDNADLKREDIHEALTKIGAEIAYIDFKVGDKEGWVRLAKENQAKEIVPKLTDGKLKVKDVEVTFKLLEGEEETKYLDKTVEDMAKRRKTQKKSFNRVNKSKGKHYGRKRRHGNHDDAPPKKVKTDS